MELESSIDPIEQAFFNLKTARAFLFQIYSEPDSIFPLKKHIRQNFSQEVKEIIKFFYNNNAKLLKNDRDLHHALNFAMIPKNQMIKTSKASKRLSTPCQKDMNTFERFFFLQIVARNLNAQ